MRLYCYYLIQLLYLSTDDITLLWCRIQSFSEIETNNFVYGLQNWFVFVAALLPDYTLLGPIAISPSLNLISIANFSSKSLRLWIEWTFIFVCRHQIQHYTGQLAKDSAKHLKDLNGAVRAQRGAAATTSEQRQRRLQFDSLQDDFTKALNSFQQVQTQAAQKEKDVIKKARNNSGEALLILSMFV